MVTAAHCAETRNGTALFKSVKIRYRASSVSTALYQGLNKLRRSQVKGSIDSLGGGVLDVIVSTIFLALYDQYFAVIPVAYQRIDDTNNQVSDYKQYKDLKSETGLLYGGSGYHENL